MTAAAEHSDARDVGEDELVAPDDVAPAPPPEDLRTDVIQH
jgi:hypothetical protein